MKQTSQAEAAVKQLSPKDEKRKYIHTLYLQYVDLKADPAHTDNERLTLRDLLLTEVNDLCALKTKSLLHSRMKECDYKNNWEDVLESALLSVLELLEKADAPRNIDNFAGYAAGIYEKRAKDVIREITQKRGASRGCSEAGQYEDVEAKKSKKRGGRRYHPETSLSTPLNSNSEDDFELGQTLMSEDAPNPENEAMQEEKRQTCRRVWQLYCNTLLTSDADPQKCLALYYAKVLPHLLHEVVSENEGISANKASSAKWAFEQMGKHTIQELWDESNKTMMRYFGDPTATWGENFRSRLEQDSGLLDWPCRLGDVVYTEVYKTDRIENWAESMHRKVFQSVLQQISADQELAKLVDNFAEDCDGLKPFTRWKENLSC